MRFYPFGSGSTITGYVSSSRYADYSNVAESTIQTISASWAISGSIGPQGDPGTPSTFHGPYDYYPQP